MSAHRDNPPSNWFPRAVAVPGGDVYASIDPDGRSDESYVWHWCPVLGRWEGACIAAHTIVQQSPLTITASLYMPHCCGWHGWITDGTWRSV